MQLTFLGGDSGRSGSPRVYATDRATFIVQGSFSPASRST